MPSSPAQSIPKAPAERTLAAAVAVLIVVAVVQIVAAGLALVPRIDFDKFGRSLASRPAEAPSVAPAPAPPPQVSQQDASLAEASALLADAAKFRAENNFQGALEAVTEADRLVPGKPGILIQIASDQTSLGMDTEAISTLRKIVALPAREPGDARYIAQAKQGLAEMTGTSLPVSTEAASPAPAVPGAPPAAEQAEREQMRDANFIPIGSVMGIVDAKLKDATPGQKKLSVSMKAASDQKVDPTKVEATVDFYEQDDHAQIVRNDAPHPAEWLSGPNIDWANGDPEVFQLGYSMPAEGHDNLPPLQYYGYVIAIYYDGELQDQRADPPSLLKEHAPPLHKEAPVPTE